MVVLGVLVRFKFDELGGVVRVGSTVGTVAGLGFLQPREGHRSDDPRIAADAQRPVRGAAGDI